MSHGIQIFNARGGVQFDSEKNRETYIVTSTGSGTSVPFTDTEDKILFVKGTDPDLLYWGNAHDDGNFYFHAWDVENAGTETVTEDFTSLSSGDVTMSYFIAEKSNSVTIPPGETHGIQIKNPNGDVQFDTRTMIGSFNFTLTSAYRGGPYGIKLIDDITNYVSFSGGWPSRKSIGRRSQLDKKITGCRWRDDTDSVIYNCLGFDTQDQRVPGVEKNRGIQGPIFTAKLI